MAALLLVLGGVQAPDQPQDDDREDHEDADVVVDAGDRTHGERVSD